MDSQNEERILFDSLALWQEGSHRELSNILKESHRGFSDIIKSYCTRVRKGTNELSEELCELKAQLSVITQERDILLEKVDHLIDEIKGLEVIRNERDLLLERVRGIDNLIDEIKGLEVIRKERDLLLERVDKLSGQIKRLEHAVPQSEQSHNPDDTREAECLNSEVQDVGRPRITTETGDPEKLISLGTNEDPFAVEEKEGEDQPDEKPPVETQHEQPLGVRSNILPERVEKSWDCNICKTQVKLGGQESHLMNYHNMTMKEYLKIQTLNKLSNQLNKTWAKPTSLLQVGEANTSSDPAPQNKTQLPSISRISSLQSKSQDQIQVKNEAPYSTETKEQEAIVKNKDENTPVLKQAVPTDDKSESTKRHRTESTSLEVKSY